MGPSEESALPSNNAGLVDGSSTHGSVRFIDSLPVHVKEFIAGGAAGAFANTAVALLDRSKILLQTRIEGFHSLRLCPSLKKLLKHEGVQGPYKGSGANVLSIVPYAAIYYMTFERCRYWVLKNYPSFGSGPCLDLLAGSAAGGAAVLCTYPLDLARTKLAYQAMDKRQSFRTGTSAIHSHAAYYCLQDVLKNVYKEGGVRALYQGIGPTLVGVLPYAGLKFYVYEELKRQVPEEHQKSITMQLSCGAVAGFLGQTFTYPLDVVREQMQVESLHEGDARYKKNTMERLINIVRNPGCRQLFAGLKINYMKAVPSAAIGFTAYDMMKSWMCVTSQQKF
ncbi:mitochondrial carrier protein CoAc1-like [Malania oleifera]|uniref:mitochondrial carrier protein CoAc1-like n=1 Tax=Malania oleifera TaxID=397392 RepID=UPI0025AE0811|nr:mitochondrial carrier protein CoAc1-like [Malania oleifera]